MLAGPYSVCWTLLQSVLSGKLLFYQMNVFYYMNVYFREVSYVLRELASFVATCL